ncbi:MAG: hypothetical protein JSS07_05105 [Proteobacteria bacterium]|nr:hypothetical protein [Pseudomonadota bacterium]
MKKHQLLIPLFIAILAQSKVGAQVNVTAQVPAQSNPEISELQSFDSMLNEGLQNQSISSYEATTDTNNNFIEEEMD